MGKQLRNKHQIKVNKDLKWSIIIILISILVQRSESLSVKIAIDTTSSDTLVSSYYTNTGQCSCDIRQSQCDIFCCCDTFCSSNQISTWNNNNECLNKGSSIQRSCDQLSQGGFMSFEDLGCVYYSNRGNTSYFYSYPDSGSINYPSPNKFVSVASIASPINILTSTATNDPYSSSQLLLKMDKDGALKYFELWSPVAGGSCNYGYVNISQSQTFSCQYNLNADTCPINTNLFQGVINICTKGDCSTIFNLPTVTSALTTGTICQNMIKQQKIDLTLSSSGSSYNIDQMTVTFTTQNVDFSINKKYSIKTIINVIKAASLTSFSGNPGYLLGKTVNMESNGAIFNLFNIADALGNCVTAGTSPIQLLFGQNNVYSCVSSNPCASSLYIDQLAKQQTLKLQKWAKGSPDTIQVAGTSLTSNTCSAQSIVLNILYTNAGWVADMQNYIIGAEITSLKSQQTTWNRKYLKINWIFVDPSTIQTPPNNYFYEYFSQLWKPLRQYFGVY